MNEKLNAEVRKQVNELLDNGFKQVYICQQCNISTSQLCKFRKGNINIFNDAKLNFLKTFLKKYQNIIN